VLKYSLAHLQQVEDTLNNSNELFMTFRKEMEDMSKKTKRLERENQTLSRKHEQTNRNILEMMDERTRDKTEIEQLRRQETQMRNIIKTMQEQGRGLPAASGGDDLHDDGTESEYDEEYDDEDDYLEGDEEELAAHEAELAAAAAAAHAQIQTQPHVSEKPVFGPVPPPGLHTKAPVANGVGGKH
jgi:hypothetical protein